MSSYDTDSNVHEFKEETKNRSLYRFDEVEAKTAKPQTINAAIKEVLRANHSACYVAMERYLMPPGVCGSRYFDQANAVRILKEHDVEGNGRIAMIIEETGMSDLILWNRLQACLRQAGFNMRHGRMVGLLEHKTSKPEVKDENGQPDIA